MGEKSGAITLGIIVTLAAIILVGFFTFPIIDVSGMSKHGIEEIFKDSSNEDETDKNLFDYIINDTNTITITGYNGKSSEVIIPAQIEGKDVTIIGYMAFSNKKITKVTFPKTLKEIRSNAFSNNKITALELPDNIQTIGSGAFYKNTLTDVFIYNRDVVLGSLIFSNNGELNVYGYTGSTAYEYARKHDYINFIPLDAEIFEHFIYVDNKDGTATITGYVGISVNITIPSEIAGLRVTDIGKNALSNKNLLSVTIPQTVKRIHKSAFEKNSLRELIIPESVELIQENAFNMNRLEDVYVYNNTVNYGQNVFHNQKNVPTYLYGLDGSTSEDYANQYNYLEFVSLSEPEQPLQDFLYTDNRNGTATIIGYIGQERDISIPSEINGLTVVRIGNFAFEGLQLNRVTIPSSVTSIGVSAFKNSGLTEVGMTKSVNEIEKEAFANNKLKSITLPENLKSISEGSFKNNSLTTITIPYNVEDIEKEAFANNQISNVQLGYELKVIGEYAFQNNRIKEVSFPYSNKLTTISKGAFKGNEIDKFSIPAHVSFLGEEAFADNASIEEFNVYNNLMTFEENVFNNNPNVILYGYSGSTSESYAQRYSNIEFRPFSSKETDPNLFTYLLRMDGTAIITGYKGTATDIVIPKQIDGYTVVGIATKMSYIKPLTSVVIPNTVEFIGSYAFYGNNLNQIVIPEGVDRIEEFAFANNKLTTVNIPSSVRTLGNSVFSNNKLSTITLAEGTTSIGEYAFSNNELTLVQLPDTLTHIGKGAFSNNGLTEISIPENIEKIEDYTFATNNIQIVDWSGNLKEIGVGAFENNDVHNLTFLEGLEKVNGKAFANNPNLTDVIAYNKSLEYDDGAENGIFDGIKEVIVYGYTGSTTELYAESYENLIFVPIDSGFETPPEWFDYIVLYDGTARITGYHGEATNIVIPKKIDGYTVSELSGLGNKGLRNITIPETVVNILDNAFENNDLKHLAIPKTVQSLGSDIVLGNPIREVYVFNRNLNFKDDSLYRGGEYEYMYGNEKTKVYGYKPSSAELYVDSYNTDIENSLVFIELPYHSTDSSLFQYKDNGDGTATITKYVGKETDIAIPKQINGLKVIAIGDSAFSSGTKLTSVIIPDGVTTIGKSAFNRNSLSLAIIPHTVTSIGDSAFGNNNLISVDLPINLKTIGSKAFSYNDLTRIVIPGSVKQIGSGAFEANKLSNVILPYGIETIENSVFMNNYLTSVTIPESVTKIGSYAFGYNDLISVTIPKNVELIGDNAFSFNDLKEVTILNKNAQLGSTLFRYNSYNDLTLFGYKGSTTQTYAESNGYNFIVIYEGNKPLPSLP